MGLFIKDIFYEKNKVIKSYDKIKHNKLKDYIKVLKANKIKIAEILKIEDKNDKTIITQRKINGQNLSQYLLQCAVNNSKMTCKVFRKFKQFIKYYFRKIYPLRDYSVDCKLANFMRNLTLVDIVPVLDNKEFSKEENCLKYVCFNKDTQIKNIISYWFKTFILFSYNKNQDPITALREDFNKAFKYVSKYYKFKDNEELNEIEKSYCRRFEILKSLDFNNFEDFKQEYINNNFYRALENKSGQNPIGRVYLIGGSGVGKSFVTKYIIENTNAVNLNLDNIYWKQDSASFSVEEDEEIRDKKLNDILNENINIVVEGSYIKDWVLPIFEKSDKIFVINSNYKFQRKRIIKRFIKRKLKIEKINRKETLKSICGLLNWTKTYNQNLEIFIREHFDKYKEKITFVNSANDVLTYLFGL